LGRKQHTQSNAQRVPVETLPAEIFSGLKTTALVGSFRLLFRFTNIRRCVRGLLAGAGTLDQSQRNKCHAIIHVASAGAAAIGAGLAQIPLADNAVIVPIQITMVMSLGKVFNVSLSKAAAEGTALGATATLVGRTTSQVLLGWIPVLGNAINAATAAAITEAMGWVVAAQFARGQIKGS
jgi:uncharacterized protein (DUF697 family)